MLPRDGKRIGSGNDNAHFEGSLTKTSKAPVPQRGGLGSTGTRRVRMLQRWRQDATAGTAQNGEAGQATTAGTVKNVEAVEATMAGTVKNVEAMEATMAGTVWHYEAGQATTAGAV